jgi:hypothetical protein
MYLKSFLAVLGALDLSPGLIAGAEPRSEGRLSASEMALITAVLYWLLKR